MTLQSDPHCTYLQPLDDPCLSGKGTYDFRRFPRACKGGGEFHDQDLKGGRGWNMLEAVEEYRMVCPRAVRYLWILH